MAGVLDQIPSHEVLLRKTHKKVKKMATQHPEYAGVPDHLKAAIVLYTMENVPSEASPYYLVNAALRAKEREKVKPWRDYIWLLLHALRRLPAAPTTKVFRGMKRAVTELGPDYANGEEFVWSGFSSTATTMNVMNTFVGSNGGRVLLDIELTEPVGRDIQAFSLFPGENEILLPPNAQFEAVSRFDAGHGLTILQCKQVPSDEPLFHLAVQ